MVKFAFESSSQEVLRQAKKLKGRMEFIGIFIKCERRKKKII